MKFRVLLDYSGLSPKIGQLGFNYNILIDDSQFLSVYINFYPFVFKITHRYHLELFKNI